MPVVPALHDPLTVLKANDLADVVTPDHDSVNGRATDV
jgi:hypothetical protein